MRFYLAYTPYRGYIYIWFENYTEWSNMCPYIHMTANYYNIMILTVIYMGFYVHSMHKFESVNSYQINLQP